MCVFVSLPKAILLQGKIKIYINTQFSESDINHKNEIPGHRRGSELQLLGRRRKEKLSGESAPRPPTAQGLFCTCSRAQLCTES